MATRAVAQLALDEEIVENQELEAALEERERRKERSQVKIALVEDD
jgi:hypothetical protein